MADRAISELTAVTTVNGNDSFVLEQNSRAMRLPGQVLLNWLVVALDGHGGVNNIQKTSTSGITDTYTITYADQTTTTFTVTNGRGVTGVSKTGTNVLKDTYKITYNDGTSDTFIVTNGRSITKIQKTSTNVLEDTYTVTYNDNTTSTFKVNNGRSVSNIAKSGTSGLADTYTISYNDNSVSTFTVTNGAKGDKGDNTYTWIRYSTNSPTRDADMHTTPDNWIGVYFGSSSTAPTKYTSYQWFQIKGEKGDKGDNLTITSTSVSYQTSSSNTDPPTTWSSTIPSTPQGAFLWTRTMLNYSTGNSLTYYTVSRNGMDGSGSVVTVQGVSPDSSGNVDLVNVVGNKLVIG